MNRRLRALGADRICPLGEGDADGNIEEDFLKWKDIFRESLIKQFSIDPDSIGQFVGRDYDAVFHSNEDVTEVCTYL